MKLSPSRLALRPLSGSWTEHYTAFRPHLVKRLALSLGLAVLGMSAQATNWNVNPSVTGNWDASATWATSIPAGGPTGAGNTIGTTNSGSPSIVTLNVSGIVIGRIANANTGSRHLTIADGGFTLTMDNSGSAGNASLAANSNTSNLTVNTNVSIANTDLDLITSGTGGAVTIGVLGTNTITATSTKTLNLNANGDGGIIINSSIAATGSTINIVGGSSTGNGTINGVFGGSGMLTQNGSTTLTLTGVNTYTGGTTITAGTVTVSGAGQLGSGTYAGAISNAGTFNYNSSAAQTLSGVVSGAGTLNKGTGGNTLVLSGANTYNGATQVTAGTLAGVGANAFGSTTSIGVGVSGTLSLRGDASTSFVKASDSSAYTISITGSGATINVDQATGSGTAAKTMTIGNIGTTSPAATYQINFTGANNTSLIAGAVTGAASTAVGTDTINNTNTTGLLTLGSYASANTSGGDTVIFTGSGNTTVTGAITPSATTLALTKSGTGTLTLAGSSSYSGVTSINGGTVSVLAIGNSGSNSALGTNGTINIGTVATAGTLLYTSTGSNETSDKVINLAGTTGGATMDQSGTNALKFTSALTATGANSKTLILQGSTAGTGEIAGAIVDNLTGTNKTSVTKAGTGTWTLSGVNSYTGNTTVNGGTLKLDRSSNTNATVSASSILALGGGTLSVFGNGTNSGTQTVASTTLNAGASNVSVTETGGIAQNVGLGTITRNAGSGLAFTLPTSGAITVGGSTGILLGGNNSSYGLIIDSGGNVTDIAAVNASNQIAGGVSVLPNTTAGWQANPNGGTGLTTGVPEYVFNNTTGGSAVLGGNATIGSFLFNTFKSGGWVFTPNNSGRTATLSRIVLTNGVGASNVSIGGSGIIRVNTEMILDQYNTGGFLTINPANGFSSTGTGNLTKIGPGTLVINPTGASTYAAATFLNGGVTMIGSNGAVKNDNTNINLNGGTLMGTADFALDNGAGVLHPVVLGNNGGGLAAQSSTTFTVTGVVSGSGPLVIGIPASSANGNTAGLVPGTGTGTANTTGVNATGIVTLTGANTYTSTTILATGTANAGVANVASTSSAFGVGGNITFTGGTLQYSAASASSDYSSRIKNSTSAVVIDTNAQTTPTFASVLDSSNMGGLTKSNTGTLTLTAANAYTGVTTVSGGTLKTTGSGKLGSVNNGLAVTAGTLDLNGNNQGVGALSGAGTIDNVTTGTTNTLTVGNNNATGGNFSGLIKNTTGTLSLTKTGSGTQTLSGANSYSGLTTVSAGTLTVQNNTALGTTAAGTSLSSGAVLRLDKGAGSDLAIGAEALTLNGAGLTGSPNGALRNVSGNNSYAGAITLGSASNIQSDASQTLTLTGGIDNGGFLVTVQGAGNTTVSTGAITGAGGLTKNDAGTFLLSANNTYTGPTNVTGGTLEISGGIGGSIGSTSSLTIAPTATVLASGSSVSNVLGSTATNVDLAGGTLRFSGSTVTQSLGQLTLSQNSTLDFGAGSGDQVTFTLGFAAHTADTTKLSIQNWSGTPFTEGGAPNDRLIFTSNDAVTNDALLASFTSSFGQNDISFDGVTGYQAIQFGNHLGFEIVAVPEPSSSALIGAAGLLGLVGFRERRRLLGTKRR